MQAGETTKVAENKPTASPASDARARHLAVELESLSASKANMSEVLETRAAVALLAAELEQLKQARDQARDESAATLGQVAALQVTPANWPTPPARPAGDGENCVRSILLLLIRCTINSKEKTLS